jgi:hypothetical protein
MTKNTRKWRPVVTALALAAVSIVGFGPVVAAAQAATPTAPATNQVLQLFPFMSYRVQATPTRLPEVGATIRAGQEVAAFTVKPTRGAILQADSAPRPQVFPQTIASGTRLFETQLEDGTAYCAFWADNQGERDTQCFRDIDGDGTFDGSYRTAKPLYGTRLHIGQLALLQPTRKIGYERIVVEDFPTDVWSYRFIRVRRGYAEFMPQFSFSRSRWQVLKCKLEAGGICVMGNLTLKLREAGGGIIVDDVATSATEFVLAVKPS